MRGESDPDAAATAWMEAERGRPCDLARGPLFAQALLRLRDDHVLWYQRYHHIAVDAAGVVLISRRAASSTPTAPPPGRPPGNFTASSAPTRRTAPPTNSPPTAPTGRPGSPAARSPSA
ncbi:condensation domain-containing protein [Streptomyces stramineus]